MWRVQSFKNKMFCCDLVLKYSKSDRYDIHPFEISFEDEEFSAENIRGNAEILWNILNPALAEYCNGHAIVHHYDQLMRFDYESIENTAPWKPHLTFLAEVFGYQALMELQLLMQPQ